MPQESQENKKVKISDKLAIGLWASILFLIMSFGSEFNSLGRWLSIFLPFFSEGFWTRVIVIICNITILYAIYSIYNRFKIQIEEYFMNLFIKKVDIVEENLTEKINNSYLQAKKKLDEIETRLITNPARLVPSNLNNNLKSILIREGEEYCGYFTELDTRQVAKIRNDIAFELTIKLFRYGSNFTKIRAFDQTYERWKKEFKVSHSIALPVYSALTESIKSMMGKGNCKDFKRLFIISEKEFKTFDLTLSNNSINIEHIPAYEYAKSNEEILDNLKPKDIENIHFYSNTYKVLNKNNGEQIKLIKSNPQYTLDEFILGRIRFQEKQISNCNIETRVLVVRQEQDQDGKISSAKDFIMFDNKFFIEEDVNYQNSNIGKSSINITESTINENLALFDNLYEEAYIIKVV